MDRRWFGALVVVCVLLAAVIAPNLTTRRVAGSPVAVAVDEPPVAGTCLTAMTDPWGSNPEPGFAVRNTIDFPSATFGPCEGPVVGELAGIDMTAAPPRRMVDTVYQDMVGQCALDAIGYLGSIPPVVDRGVGQPGIVWSSVLTFRFTQLGPTAVQRAAGQQWSACAVGPADLTPYVGRLRDVFTTGVLPPVFGSCWSSVDFHTAEAVPCDSAHAIELLGWASLGPNPVATADVQDACSVYAARALRTPDPTRNGAIRPEIVDSDRDVATVLPMTANLADSYVACALIAEQGRLFTNTLIGIGERPLPLA